MPTKLSSSEFPSEQYPFRIRNWEKLQHYKHRNPPWIKLHIELLSSPEWVCSTDATKLSMVCCMVVASMTEGWVRNDPKWIKDVCHLNWRVDFKPLIECGFLVNMLADASLSLQSASNLLARGETEKKDALRTISEPNGSALVPSIESPEKQLYRRGREVLGKSGGGMIANLLRAKHGSVPLARAAIEQASEKQNPREYIGRIIAGPAGRVTAEGQPWPEGIV